MIKIFIFFVFFIISFSSFSQGLESVKKRLLSRIDDRMAVYGQLRACVVRAGSSKDLKKCTQFSYSSNAPHSKNISDKRKN